MFLTFFNIFFNLLIIDGRGKDKLFSQQISPKAQLIVWITDELESLDLNPNIAVWPQQSLAFNYFDNTAPFYLWLQKQIQAQNADIQADTNSELNNFEGKIPLLLTFGTKKIAVFADFFSYTDTENSYLWEIYTQNQLQKTDVLFYKTYTSAWRENAAAELKKLLAVCD